MCGIDNLKTNPNQSMVIYLFPTRAVWNERYGMKSIKLRNVRRIDSEIYVKTGYWWKNKDEMGRRILINWEEGGQFKEV